MSINSKNLENISIHEKLEMWKREGELHEEIRQEFESYYDDLSPKTIYEDFDYLMFYIWIHYLNGENIGYGYTNNEEYHKQYNDKTVTVSYEELKKIFGALIDMSFFKGHEEGTNEMKKVHYKELGELKDKHREEIRSAIREHCDHEWGPVNWTWSCGGYRTCRKCGKTEDYYERD